MKKQIGSIMMNKEKIREVLIISVIIAIVVMPTSVNANGGVVVVPEISPELEKHISLPSQKAAIAWDGENEILIISTKIKGENLTNIAWIIPIPSETKPVVEKGDVKIFKDISYLFSEIKIRRYIHKGVDSSFAIFVFVLTFIIPLTLVVFGLVKRKNEKIAILCFTFAAISFVFGFLFFSAAPLGGGPRRLKAEITPLEIIEAKKVGIYNVLILKATNSSYMVDWLNKHNYKISNESIPILQQYCAHDDFYFVVNKIDAENLSERERAKIEEDFSKGAATPLMIKFKPKEPFYPLKISSINKGNTTINVYFFSHEPVRDKSGILKIKDVRDVEKVMHLLGLSQHFMPEKNFTIELPTPYKKPFVTWLQYQGDLSNLDNDSYFVFDAFTCENLPPERYGRFEDVGPGKDECYYRLAIETENSSLCDMIQEKWIKYGCYRDVSIETKNPISAEEYH